MDSVPNEYFLDHFNEKLSAGIQTAWKRTGLGPGATFETMSCELQKLLQIQIPQNIRDRPNFRKVFVCKV